MTVFIVCSIIAAYFFMAGVFGTLAAYALTKRCDKQKPSSSKPTIYTSQREENKHSSCEHVFYGGVLGAGWPAGLFIIFGITAGDCITTRPERLVRKEQRSRDKHQRRLAELESMRRNKELDIQEMELTAAQLEKYGVKATVNGLREAILDE